MKAHTVCGHKALANVHAQCQTCMHIEYASVGAICQNLCLVLNGYHDDKVGIEKLEL